MEVLIPNRQVLLAVTCLLSLAACGGAAPAPAASTAPQAAPETPAASAPVTSPGSVVHTSVAPAAATHACMIAGEFTLMGKTIRSRDCVQTTAASSEADLQRICGGLAQTSAQMGGKAGEVTYMAACPAPSQGSCKKLFGGKFDGYYYERTPQDLADLPASCTQGGGIWVAG
ncbi:hypothetical protein [Stenotrophomonas humi]|uniref:hypothetical protein n=1 Tax=Stenotrophomonas humi TaxID=405444 RepID=UPI0007093C32|nr:hypothetical protein [Stenotrophomonas humi]